MTDSRPPEPREPESSMSETLDLATRRLAVGIAAAGAFVALAIYGRPAPPRFEAFAVGNQIVRVDTRKGTIISCEGTERCKLVLQKGQRLTVIRRTKALPEPAAPKPLPAPPAAEKSAPAPKG